MPRDDRRTTDGGEAGHSTEGTSGVDSEFSIGSDDGVICAVGTHARGNLVVLRRYYLNRDDGETWGEEVRLVDGQVVDRLDLDVPDGQAGELVAMSPGYTMRFDEWAELGASVEVGESFCEMVGA